jgi:hypothetical protein
VLFFFDLFSAKRPFTAARNDFARVWLDRRNPLWDNDLPESADPWVSVRDVARNQRAERSVAAG